MKSVQRKLARRPVPVILVFAVALCPLLRAEALRTQTISLHQGWNSVFLEVSPTNPEPAAVFTDLPVTIAATYVESGKAVEFVSDPATIQWKQEGWRVWYSPNRPDAFLSTLHAVYGNRAYLLFASRDCTWNLTGAVWLEPTRWKSDSFNLTGFCLNPQTPPTFDQFFSGSLAHRPARVYRLVNDQWSLVTDPVRTAMRPGEACWIYCKGRSDYQGPLTVKLAAGNGIDFSAGSATWLSVLNRSANPADVQLERVTSGGEVPLAYTLRAIRPGVMEELNVDLPQSLQIPALEPSTSRTLQLTLRRERMTLPIQTTLLKVSADCGAQYWIPVVGTQTTVSVTE